MSSDSNAFRIYDASAGSGKTFTLVREYLILLFTGIGTGFIAAIVATLPSILNTHTGTSFTSILLWLLVLVVNGWLWIQLVTRSALKNESIYAALRND